MSVRKIFKDDVLASIIIAEELANILSLDKNKENERKEAGNVSERQVRNYRTKFYRKKFSQLFGDYTFLSVQGAGRLREFSFVSDSKDYELILVVDGYAVYSDTFDKLANVSEYARHLDAFQTDEGKYVLRLGKIYFSNSILLKIHPIKILYNVFSLVVYDVYC